MKISLIAIGTKMPQWVTLGFQEYCQRLPKDYSLQLIEIPAEKRPKTFDVVRLLEREGEHMRALIPKNNLVIALTERGQSWNNEELSQKLHNWHDEGQDISLLIGGPEGLAPACLNAASYHWSLSPLTLPHPLVRIIVAEQIYRSWSIIQGHPYHRA